MTKTELITSHIFFAEELAKRKKRCSPSYVYLEDLKSAAYKGLVDAAEKYKEGSFRNFAKKRILGEMHDYIMGLYWGGSKKKQPVFPLKEDLIDSKPNKNIDDITEFLSYDMRIVLNWLFVENMSYAEVGEKLGIDKSVVYRRVKKCFEEIKWYLMLNCLMN